MGDRRDGDRDASGHDPVPRHVLPSYSATARYLGAPATLHVRKLTIDIHVGDEQCEHRREDHTRDVRRLPVHREDVLAVLHGRRKLATFRRKCLLELGQPAWQILGQLVHRCPQGSWEKPCSDLYELRMLTTHGDGAMLDAFTRCVELQIHTRRRARRAQGGSMTPSEIDLDALLKSLHVPTVRRLYPDYAARAAAEG